MLFNSIEFLIFFPIVVLVFLIIPKKLRTVWLLIASYYFYMSWNPKYAVLIGMSTIITYLSGIFIDKFNSYKKKKIVVALSLLSNLGILAVFKYANFALDTINDICSKLWNINLIERRLDLLLPVGISFYTFQALSYTIDVYRNNIKAEKNILNYALFVSFFPQLVAGPIERSGNLLKQIQNIKGLRLWDNLRIKDGLMLMFWGLFQKLVIADRASILVNQVYGNYQNYGFIELSIASVLFAFQIYCDFGGYTNIARGAAKVMGFSLMENFKQPYLATNIKDFWRRWHISLTSWFTDYLYIPLGGNRKGDLRKYLNVLIVFGVSGLWHGASRHFVVWGLIHAVFQIIGDIKERVEKRLYKNGNSDSLSKRLRKGFFTFVLVDFAWVFFAADSIHHALGILRQMFSAIITTSLYEIGLDRANWQILKGAIVILFVMDILHEKGISVLKLINSQEIWLRMLIYLSLIWSIIMFGIYGVGYDTSRFIYFQF